MARGARFAPGYLFLPGMFHLATALEAVPDIRLLVHSPAHRETLEQTAQRRHRVAAVKAAAEARSYPNRTQARQILEDTSAGFRADLEALDQSPDNLAAGRLLLRLLAERRFAVRVNTVGPLGPRGYLFDGIDSRRAILSACNALLPAGLDPTDFHAELTGIESDALSAWFDRLWDSASDVTALLVEELRRSWVGSLASPYDVYMKTLYTLVGDRVETDDEVLLDTADIHAHSPTFNRPPSGRRCK